MIIWHKLLWFKGFLSKNSYGHTLPGGQRLLSSFLASFLDNFIVIFDLECFYFYIVVFLKSTAILKNAKLLSNSKKLQNFFPENKEFKK